jgi:hypothetical protein
MAEEPTLLSVELLGICSEEIVITAVADNVLGIFSRIGARLRESDVVVVVSHLWSDARARIAGRK